VARESRPAYKIVDNVWKDADVGITANG